MTNAFTTHIINHFKLTDICEPYLPEFPGFPEFSELPPELTINKIIGYVGTIYRISKENEEYEMFEQHELDADYKISKEQYELVYLETKRKDQINFVGALTKNDDMYSRYETNTLTEKHIRILKYFISPDFRPFHISYLNNCCIKLTTAIKQNKLKHDVSLVTSRKNIHEYYRKYIPALIIPNNDYVCMNMELIYLINYRAYESIKATKRRDLFFHEEYYLLKLMEELFNSILFMKEKSFIPNKEVCETCTAQFNHEEIVNRTCDCLLLKLRNYVILSEDGQFIGYQECDACVSKKNKIV